MHYSFKIFKKLEGILVIFVLGDLFEKKEFLGTC